MKLKISVLLLMMFSLGILKAQVTDRFENKKPSQDSPSPEPQETPATPPPATIKAENEASDFWDRVIYGGNASASFGNYTLIYISPSIGYKVRDNLIAGGGFIYQYARINQVYNLQTASFVEVDGYENQVFGPKVFVNYFPVEMIYVGTQFELLNHDVALYNPAGNPQQYLLENQWTPVLFLEGGYAQPLGNKGYVQLGIRFNVLHDFDSPYGNSWFPVIGFFF